MQQPSAALKRRLTPSVPLTLSVENGDGSNFQVDLKLAFNMNVLASISERTKRIVQVKTIDDEIVDRVVSTNMLADVFSWIDDPKAVIAVLWGASLPYQPEFNSDEGFEAIGEYMGLENRVDTIDALLKAYASFVRNDKREAFEQSATQIVEILRTGKLPEAVPTPENETNQQANPSISMTSQISPNTTSDSPLKNSENLQAIDSRASA